METKQETNWLTYQTGDPFTDVGGYVWEYLMEKFPNKNPTQIIELVATIYIREWDQKMHPFFANSKITHNTYGGKKDKSLNDTLIFYRKVLNGSPDVVVTERGYCRMTGRQGTLFSAERSTTMLNGAGSLMNFHHALESGSMVSKEVLLRNFVMPLGAVQVGSMPAVVLSNDEQVSKFIAAQNCQAHLDNRGVGMGKGLRKAKASNPANALFDYVVEILQNIEYEFEIENPFQEGVALNLFHFSNFVNGPALQLHTLSATAFSFFGYCFKNFHKEWMAFVYAHYKVGTSKKKAKDDEANEDSPQSFPNPVLTTIMNEGNLTFAFLAWVRSDKRLNFQIVELYQLLIRNMDKRTTQLLRRIAVFVTNECSDDETTKTLRKLNSAKTRRDVFATLIKLVEKNKDNKEALIQLEDVEFLFPDGYSWLEMRNILLIAIYEQLYELNRKVGDVGEAAEVEQIEEEN